MVDWAIAENGDVVRLFEPANMKGHIVDILVKKNDEGWLFRGGEQDEGGLAYIQFPHLPHVLNSEVDLVMFIKYWESLNTSFNSMWSTCTLHDKEYRVMVTVILNYMYDYNCVQ